MHPVPPTPDALLDHLRRESRRFREVLAQCPPEVRVPSCPDWSADDLMWHLAVVQDSWRHVLAVRPAGPDEYQEPDRPGSYAGLLDFFDDAHGRFVEALARAEPAEEAWSWSTAPGARTVGWILRRQTHEALIHRRDAELAADLVSPFQPALAADGVQEVLDVMYGGLPPWGTFTPVPRYVEFRMPDVDASVWVQLGTFAGTSSDGTTISGEADFHVVAEEELEPGLEADAVVLGAAGDMDAWLWKRADDTGIEPVGDLDVYARVRSVLQQPIG